MKNSKKRVMLSIVIVNWNTKGYLTHCLDSIYKNKGKLPIEVIVIDNNSSDGSASVIRREYRWVKLIANETNNGFAKGNNQGWKKSSGEYVLFLNPDTVVHKNCLETMINFMRGNPRAGACSAKLVNPDKTDQRLGFYRRTPTLVKVFFSHTPIVSLTLKIPYLREKFFEHTDFSKIQEIDQPPGACFFTRSSILKKLEGMDERYELFFEDVDLAYRIRLKGWKQYFMPNAVITHFVGRGISQLGHSKRVFLYYKSMAKYFKKFYSMNHVRIIGVLVLFRFLYELSALSALFIPRKIIFGWGGSNMIRQEFKSIAQWIKIMRSDYAAI